MLFSSRMPQFYVQTDRYIEKYYVYIILRWTVRGESISTSIDIKLVITWYLTWKYVKNERRDIAKRLVCQIRAYYVCWLNGGKKEKKKKSTRLSSYWKYKRHTRLRDTSISKKLRLTKTNRTKKSRNCTVINGEFTD